MTAWWIVLLPGEYAETSKIYAPFRTELGAQVVADDWNAKHPGPEDKATVLPIYSPKGMR